MPGALTSADPVALLVGHPHSGKTALFNRLTHTNRPVGMTVEPEEEPMLSAAGTVRLVDLPGIYRLGMSSPEETLVLRALCDRRAKVIVSVIDSTNLDLHLYLSLQLWHFGLPVILVLNMADEADAAGLKVDMIRLEALTGARVVRTSAHRHRGIGELRELIGQLAYEEGKTSRLKRPNYGPLVDDVLRFLTEAHGHARLADDELPPSYLASRLLEGTPELNARLEGLGEEGKRFLTVAADCREELERQLGAPPAEVMADRRYGLIHGLVDEVQTGRQIDARKMTLLLDRLLTHRIAGFVVFLLLMYAIFYASFALGNPLVDLVRDGFSALGAYVSPMLAETPLLRSLVVRGVIEGVGSVVSFVPTIVILFACLSLLESTGYMARAAFLMDRFMHKMGLHGKSFIPMLLGFSCNVPAVLATRTIESRKDRLATIFVLPWMNCSARLVVFALIIDALVPPQYRSVTLWGFYLLGIGMAVAAARLLKSTLLKGEDEIFIMELPPYRLPSWAGYLYSVWEKASGYIKKAATFILFGSVVLWGLNTFPLADSENGEVHVAHAECYSARIGRLFEPVSRYAGMDWQANSAMIGAFSAKELLVTQLCILFSGDDEPAFHDEDGSDRKKKAIRAHYNLPQALGMMTFALLALPCIATVAVIRKETDSWAFTLSQFAALNVVGFLAAVAVYQVALLFAA